MKLSLLCRFWKFHSFGLDLLVSAVSTKLVAIDKSFVAGKSGWRVVCHNDLCQVWVFVSSDPRPSLALSRWTQNEAASRRGEQE